ncbi:hypothetical protein KIN20_024884 [Parelaphostrongylus tenuis]|uniref:Uncharacterized protein n=1 Tax=Parelaphostrongylus tenuis TaxID=148309 RepID=A0AAD5N8N5_PARTN|nr:hypothetical protein KIN20_024884 [Parelaphostrongylus tenuis]
MLTRNHNYGRLISICHKELLSVKSYYVKKHVIERDRFIHPVFSSTISALCTNICTSPQTTNGHYTRIVVGLKNDLTPIFAELKFYNHVIKKREQKVGALLNIKFEELSVQKRPALSVSRKKNNTLEKKQEAINAVTALTHRTYLTRQSR